MLDLVPAIQLFTLRDYIQTPEGFEKTIRWVRDMGCDTVQFSRVGPTIPPDFITNVVKEYDMKVCVSHSPMQRIFHDLPALIREHRSWGCDSVGLGNLENVYLDDGYEGYRRFIDDIAPVVEELKKNGMTFAYHSHTFEFVEYHGRRMYDMLVPMGRFLGETGTIGEGNIDYPPLLRTAARTGVKTIAIEQDRCQRDPFDSLRDAFHELKRLIEETEPEGGDRV